MRFKVLIIALVYSSSAFAQSMIAGKVIERGSNSPIPYVNVVLVGTSVGTATDEDGRFSIKIDPDHRNGILRFSSIGFLSAKHDVDSLFSVKDDIVIELAAEITLLSAVSVDATKVKPVDIISEAVQAIPRNYNQEPFNAEYYSRIATKNTVDGAPYDLESILFGRYEGYGALSKRKFKILHKRESGTNPIVEYLYWPSGELFHADLLIHPEQNGIFALRHLDKFELELEDVTTYDQDTVQVIKYRLPKPTKATTGYGVVPKEYNGKLYITLGGAVVKHTVNAPPFQFEIIYRKIGEHYYPYLIKGNRLYKNMFRITNVISLKQIELSNVQKVAASEDDWDVSKVPFDESYWRLNYPTTK